MTDTTDCRTYWTTHGCDLPRGHEGHHRCECCECTDHAAESDGNGCVGAFPYYGPELVTVFTGEDSNSAVMAANDGNDHLEALVESVRIMLIANDRDLLTCDADTALVGSVTLRQIVAATLASQFTIKHKELLARQV